jgi:hypothetical protein
MRTGLPRWLDLLLIVIVAFVVIFVVLYVLGSTASGGSG